MEQNLLIGFSSVIIVGIWERKDRKKSDKID